MKEDLRVILDIQELDIKMFRLMRVKKERQKEIQQIEALRRELHQQLSEKEKEIGGFAEQIQLLEQKILEIGAKIKKLETQQSSVKKVEEFNALTHELTALEREKVHTEQKVSDLVDRKVNEEELLTKIKESLATSEQNSIVLENELRNSIQMINQEGSVLKSQRDVIAQSANFDLLQTYEKLLRNKQDRVVVHIEHRTCSGCHITLTAQHENIVRKGENLVFCEHCSRIHYWQSDTSGEEVGGVVKRRRRQKR